MAASSELGEIVRFHRKRGGLSQLALAELAGVGKTVIFDIEKGKQTVQVDTLMKVLHVLNIRVKLEGPFMQDYARARLDTSTSI